MGLGLLGFSALLLSASRDLWLGLMVVGGFAVAVLVFAGMAWLGVMGLRRVMQISGLPIWLRMATRQISARPGYTVVQVSALSVGLLALMLLVLLRTDLVDSWRNATPADAPNRFVINIQPTSRKNFYKPWMKRVSPNGTGTPCCEEDWFKFNGENVRAERYTDERAQRLIEREFNISHAAQCPCPQPSRARHLETRRNQRHQHGGGDCQNLATQAGRPTAF
jgi:putative ABC transport system permease protein